MSLDQSALSNKEVDQNIIKQELLGIGLIVNDISDMVNTNIPYPDAIPVLLNLIQTNILKNIHIKEGIIRALAVKEAKGKAIPILLDEYNMTSKEKQHYLWAIGNTIEVTFDNEYIDDIVSIITNKFNGMSRQMFVYALRKMKYDEFNKIENIIIDLLDDPDVVTQAISVLSKQRSISAREKILKLSTDSSRFIKKCAVKALTHIDEISKRKDRDMPSSINK